MKVEIIIPGAVLFKAESDHENGYSFLRIQEFYENEDKKRQGKFYTLDEVIDFYGEKRGIFSYFEDWAGFNVPGNVVDKFIKTHKHDFTGKEQNLVDILRRLHKHEPNSKHKGKYYIIGTQSDLYVDHELCHAMWYLYPEFKKRSKKLLAKLPKKYVQCIHKWLLDCGYADNVLDDEVNAYLSTTDMFMLRETIFESLTKKQRDNLDWELIYKFVENYWSFKEEQELAEPKIKLENLK